jgi:SAM-dependent methyltransferase
MADRRNLFHNILNNPRVFLFIRAILDGGQIRHLKRVLEEYAVTSVLDIACGCGNFSKITRNTYLGIDYNPAFIAFCEKRYAGSPNRRFFVMDASNMELGSRFDTAIIINSIHHFEDGEVESILSSMRSAAQRLVIVHDAVPRKNPVSRFFYGLDRGTNFRSMEQQRRLIEGASLEIREVRYLKTFPGIYLHSTVICAV